ncbi:NAD(P)/FAD-dependent oxidoreductase [Neobacillus sp. D3-1R]|uniref:NAD(P)/FAD-dependent oxidoreductase n=1 Tax=Neobacillus sp. D3-1R TaxID=3445778 RepID=UPI003FA072E7
MHHIDKDVTVIGGGVVGTSILRELSFYDLDTMLVEKHHDVCEGASKANSGIVHTGFDAPLNSVEAFCLEKSRVLWPKLVEKLKIPFLSCGAVMVATSEEEKELILAKYIPNAIANGVEVEWIEKDELFSYNPSLTDRAIGGLLIPGEGICDPFWTTRAHAEIAVLNGAEIKLGSGVSNIESSSDDDYFIITLDNGEKFSTKYIVNAAGLWADEIANLIGDYSFNLKPRKGQFILTEEVIEISQIILPVPTEKSKGLLVSPVVFGGFLLGPTAEDQEDKWDRDTTINGIRDIAHECSRLIPNVTDMDSIRQFAGLRAVCSTNDYVIRPSEVNQRMIHAAGIRSTGISASPGIAKLVVEQFAKIGVTMPPKEVIVEELPELLQQEKPGEIVCLCRSITKGEIENAFNRPFASFTLDGVKRRTGAMLGECQGNCCIPSIIEMINKAKPTKQEIYKGLQSSIVLKRGKK